MGDESLLRPGEVVLLVDLRRGKRHLVTLRSGQAFHSDRGFIPYDSLVGLPEGVVLATTKGARYLALRPTLAEYVLEMPRGAQIIYPKDLATIALFADVGPGQTVVEAGLGSGALTLVLLRLVGPTGRVVSYETREEFARRAQRNIEARIYRGLERLNGNGSRADLLNALQMWRGDPGFVNQLVARYRAVTPAQVQEAVRRFLNTDARVVLTVNPAPRTASAQ